MSDEEMLEYIKKELLKYFNGDEVKANLWMKTENLNFGGFSPDRLIKLGKVGKVYQFVKAAREDNEE